MAKELVLCVEDETGKVVTFNDLPDGWTVGDDLPDGLYLQIGSVIETAYSYSIDAEAIGERVGAGDWFIVPIPLTVKKARIASRTTYDEVEVEEAVRVDG